MLTPARWMAAFLVVLAATFGGACVQPAAAWDAIPGLSSHTAITRAAIEQIVTDPTEPADLRWWTALHSVTLMEYSGSIILVRRYGELIHDPGRPLDRGVDASSCALPNGSLGSTPTGAARWAVGNNPGTTHPEYWWQTAVCLQRGGHEAEATAVLGQLLHAIQDQGALPHATYLKHGSPGEDQGFEYLSAFASYDTLNYLHPASRFYPGKNVLDLGDHGDDAAAQFAIPKHVADWRSVPLAPRDADGLPAVLQATSPMQVRLDVSVAELIATPDIDMRVTYEKADGTLGIQERSLSLNGVTWEHWTIADRFAPNGRLWVSFRRPEQGVMASTGEVQVYVMASQTLAAEASKPALQHPWEYADWLRGWTQWVIDSPYWRRYYPALNVEGDLGFTWSWDLAPNAERAVLSLQWRASQSATVWAIEDAYRLFQDPSYSVERAQGDGYRVVLYADPDFNSSGGSPEKITSYSVGCEPYPLRTCGAFVAPVPHDPTAMVGDGLFRATGTGARVAMKADDLLGSFLRDRISSVEVRGARLRLYSGENLTGESRTYDADTRDLGDFDDRARSARIIPDGVGDVPIARDDSAVAAFGQPSSVNVLANDDPVDPSAVDLVVHGPRRGSAVAQPDGTIVYTPDPGFGGVDSFRYEISFRGGAIADSATVTVNVAPGPTTGDKVAWTGSGDSWSWTDPANWSPHVPEYGDSVTIGPRAHVRDVPAGTVLTDLTLDSAVLQGGALTATGRVFLIGAPEGSGWITQLSLGRLTVTGATDVRGYVYVDRPESVPSILNWGRIRLAPGAKVYGARIDNRGTIAGPSSDSAELGSVDLSTRGGFSIPPGGTIVLTNGELTLGDQGGLHGGGSLAIGAGERMRLARNLAVGAGSTLELRGADAQILGTGNLIGSGTFAWTGGWMRGHLDVAASVTTALSGPDQKILTGEDPLVPAVLNLAGPTSFEGPGLLNFNAGNAVLDNAGTFTMGAGAEILGTGGAFDNSGSIVVTSTPPGTARMQGLALHSSGAITVQEGSTLDLASESRLTQTDGVTTLAGGTIISGPVRALDILAGTLAGHGVVDGSVTNGGTVTPSPTGGVLRITGSYAQAGTGTLEEHIDTTAAMPGAGAGQLAVSGSVTLDGRVHVVVGPAAVPVNGQAVRLLTHGARAGRFASVDADRAGAIVYDTAGVDFLFRTPVVTRIDPPRGPTAGGTTVTIEGSGFVPGAWVAFGGVASPSVTYRSATTLEATAPPHTAGPVDVTVTTPDGISPTGPADLFTYDAPKAEVDTVAPTLSALRIVPARFRVTPLPGRPTGATVRFQLSERSAVTFVVQRAVSTARRGRCVPAVPPANGRPCTRFARVGVLSVRTGGAGANSFRFRGRVAGRALAPGAYRVVATAHDLAGNVAKPVRAGFHVLR